MVVLMEPGVSEEEIEEVEKLLEENNLNSKIVEGEQDLAKGRRKILAMKGDETKIDLDRLEAISGVEEVRPISDRYKLVSKELQDEAREVKIGGEKVGKDEPYLIMGPCAVESRQQLMETAHMVKEAGADALRGGAYKPRTDAYSFEGLKEKGLDLLKEASDRYDLPVVTEIMGSDLVDEFNDRDIAGWQIGTRNARNYRLQDKIAEESGKDHAVILKKGDGSTLEEWLCAADRIAHGNQDIVLCERGSKGDDYMRNRPEPGVITAVNDKSYLPVIGDPSHATGKSEYVKEVGSAYIAAGAEGLLVEAHIDPENALCDGRQSLNEEQLYEAVEEWKGIYHVKNG